MTVSLEPDKRQKEFWWCRSREKRGGNLEVRSITETNRTKIFLLFPSDFCKIVLISEFPSQCHMHYTGFTFAVLWGTGGGGRYTAVMEQNQYGFSIGVNQHGFKILMKDIPENKLTQKI